MSRRKETDVGKQIAPLKRFVDFLNLGGTAIVIERRQPISEICDIMAQTKQTRLNWQRNEPC